MNYAKVYTKTGTKEKDISELFCLVNLTKRCKYAYVGDILFFTTFVQMKQKDSILKPLEEGCQRFAIRSNADIVCFTGGTGGGKPLADNELVLTVSGWKKMIDLKVGDEMVSPLNREPSYVTDIYPQGVIPIYRLETSDGRSVRCGIEHLWMVRTEKQLENYRKGKPAFFVKTTREIIDEFLSKGKNIYLPVALPYLGHETELPIDPYVLGVWLGDGCKGHFGLLISNDESDIIEKVAERLGAEYTLHSSYSYTNRIRKNENVKAVLDGIDTTGLNIYSRERFIPQEYLHASIEQRMDLLKGLMDSDGNVEDRNRFSFSTTSERLKDGFVELCRGLGYIVGVHKENRTRYASGVCWDISIQTNDIIFSSEKHLRKYHANLEKYKNKNREYKHDHIRIKSITYIGEESARCIRVSNRDHVFVTKDFIVTHNSYALYYLPIDYLSQNDNAKIVCFMRNVADFWGSGKVADTLKKMYPLIDRSVKRQPRDPVGEIIRKQEDMGMKLYNGSEIKFQQLDNENPVVIDKIAKGLQAKKLIFDECNKFSWRTITAFMPRLRADSNGKAQILLAQNPERKCFMRKLCGKGPHGGGWINDDGTVDKSMDGVVMYFNMEDGDLEKTYFGRTKREVYEKCKEHIDSLVEQDPSLKPEDFILSMVFYTFSVRDNKKMLAKNARYRGFAANSSNAASAYSENWNHSLEDDEPDLEKSINVQVDKGDIERMFEPFFKPPQSELLKRFMTVDMATSGFDNLVIKYWELWSKCGYICKDIKYSTQNTNLEAVRMIMDFRAEHALNERDIIIDTQGFQFLRECFPSCRAFSGASTPSNRGKGQFRSMKDESAHLAMEMIKNGLIHYEPQLANMRYAHKNMQRLGGATTVLRQMIFESVIFQFTKTPNGRIMVMDKAEQKKLIKGMSPDLTDNVIMLCGATCYDCHRMLRDDAGIARRRTNAEDMLSFLNPNEIVTPTRQKIHHSDRILNIISSL